mmetsp:Transcript_54237/g.100244  ORF Transcript_54237/g.100244 Transcript_54237/m.100244 type:complete len:100 (-) Transcript_54237:224-523(-)
MAWNSMRKAISRGMETFSHGMMQPKSKIFNRTSWFVTALVVGKLTWDSEKENPVIFSEAPTLTGIAKARPVESDFQAKWNEKIAPKDMQVTWKPDQKAS